MDAAKHEELINSSRAKQWNAEDEAKQSRILRPLRSHTFRRRSPMTEPAPCSSS